MKIYLPRYIRGAFASNDDEPPIDEHSEGGEVILLVEDDVDVRAFLADALRELGYEVVAAPNGSAAISVLEQSNRRMDIMLTDVVMPGVHGREVGRRAEELRPGLPTLYMTGYSRNAVVHHGRLDEGVELLQKPISHADLAARIRALLDRARKAAKGARRT